MKVWTEDELKAQAPDLSVGQNARVEATSIEMGRGVQIGSDVQICAETLRLGDGVSIGARSSVKSLSGPAEYIELGEYAFIGNDSNVLVPVAIVGDYATLHNHALINGFAPFLFGHNSWAGQNCVLNANARLEIGNNVSVGLYTSIFSHAFFGDRLEGCEIFKEEPITIEDDAWLLGAYTLVSPGVTIGSKALVMGGSVVTKDVPANRTFSGSPAKEMVGRPPPFRTVSPEEKQVKMREYLSEFVTLRYEDQHERVSPGQYRLETATGPVSLSCGEDIAGADMSVTHAIDFLTGPLPNQTYPDRTIFSLTDRTYTKTRHPVEVEVMKFLRNPRARFVPRDRPKLLWS